MKSKIASSLVLLVSLAVGAVVGSQWRGALVGIRSKPAAAAPQLATHRAVSAESLLAPSPAQSSVDIGKLKVLLDRAFREGSPTRRQEALFDLGQRVRVLDIPQALELLLGRHETGAQNLLHLLLSRWGSVDPNAALAWVQTKGPLSLRKEALGTILSDWAAKDPSVALQWVAALPTGGEKEDALSTVFSHFAAKDPEGAWSTLKQSRYGASNERLLRVVFERWGNTDPSGAAAAASRANLPEWWVYRDIASKWAASDPGAALTWAQNLPVAAVRERAVDSALKAMARVDPQAAADAAIADSGHLDILAPDIARQWAAKDLAGAMGWATNLPPGLAQNRALQAVVQQWAQTDPQSAAAYAATLAPDVQGKAADSIAAAWHARDPVQATAWVNSLPADSRAKAADAILQDLRENPQGARDFLGSLADANLRNSRMWNLASSWVGQNLSDAVAWIGQLPSGEVQSKLDWNQWRSVRNIVSAWSEVDPESAWTFATKLHPGAQTTELLTHIAGESLQDSPATALDWLKQVSDSKLQSAVAAKLAGDVAVSFPPADGVAFVTDLPQNAQTEAAKGAVSAWINCDGRASAAEWIGQFPEGSLRDAAIAQFAARAAEDDAPAAAAAVISRYGIGQTSQQTLGTIVRKWLAQDPSAARAWVQGSALPDQTKGDLLSPSN